MVKISVIINTLNEAHNISDCVKSVQWADQIVVVDMFSDDSTAKLALELGCEVYTHKREGYVEPARHFGVSKARNPWVLILDADERCSEGLSAWIKNNLSAQKCAAISIPRRNYLKATWLRCCGWYPDSQIRLLLKDCCSFSTTIHKAPKITGETITLSPLQDAYIHHFCVNSLKDRFEKMARYGQIAADGLHTNGKTVSALNVALRVLWSFSSAYFLRGGILNGSLGIILSLERAMTTFMKYALLWEHTLDKSNKNDTLPTC